MERTTIGEGKTAKVYLKDGYAYKVFHNNHPSDWIEYEVQIQNEIVKHTKLPVLAYSYHASKREIQMPYIQGIELTNRILKEKYKNGIEDLISLQTSIYAYQNLNIPNAHQVFMNQLQNKKISDEYRELGVQYLNEIPYYPILCHFDMHFSNILYNGDYTIIDWVNAKLANPILDVARSFVILRQYAYRLSSKYLKMMVQKMKFSKIEVHKAIVVMAILRIIEIDQSEMSVLNQLIDDYRIK